MFNQLNTACNGLERQFGQRYHHGASVRQRKSIEMNFFKRKGYANLRAVGGWLSRCAPTGSTIRTQILICCLLMRAITATLGAYAPLAIRHAGDIVPHSFRDSLMSIHHARGTAAEF